jgi:hypothetical protein
MGLHVSSFLLVLFLILPLVLLWRLCWHHLQPSLYLDIIPGQMSDMYKWPQRLSS